VFAGQLGFGCSYAFNDYISADLGYRFLFMGDGETEYQGHKMESLDNYAHQFMLGLRVTF
jgi:opacity protein-like surface antigen